MRAGEVAQRENRADAALEAAVHEPVVMVEGRLVDGALLGLDAAPLHREAVGVEPHGGNAVEVVLPALPAAAGLPRRHLEHRRGHMLQKRGVRHGVVAVGLVPRRRHAPEKPIGLVHDASFPVEMDERHG